jgi:hypothetical protein
VNTNIATEADRPRIRRSTRSLAVLAIGPVTVLAGIVWAFAQPYRLTLLHPAEQGFWWLFVEPPLWVVAAGLLFQALIAPGVVADLEEDGG